MSLSLIIKLIGDNNSYQQSKMRRYYKVSDNAKRDTFLAGPRHSFFSRFTNVVVFRSYTDFLLVSFVMFHYGLPLPAIAAGMDFKVIF